MGLPLSFMGYGAVVPGGYGVSYNPTPDDIIFCICRCLDSSYLNHSTKHPPTHNLYKSMVINFLTCPTVILSFKYICVPKMIYRYKRDWSDRNELKAYTTSHYIPKDEIQAMEKKLVNYPLNNLNISFHSCPETSSRRFATTLQQSLQVR